MRLWTFRHGYAGPASKDPTQERERPLLPEGIAIVKKMAKAIVAADGDFPDVLFASPYARAIQTADILGRIWGIRVSQIDDLAPNRPLTDRLLELMNHSELRRFGFVAHHDNTTPAFNFFGGDMDGEPRDDDDDLRDALGYESTVNPGDPGDASGSSDWVPLVMAECRRLKIDRKTGEWVCKFRLRPSDVGMRDY